MEILRESPCTFKLVSLLYITRQEKTSIKIQNVEVERGMDPMIMFW